MPEPTWRARRLLQGSTEQLLARVVYGVLDSGVAPCSASLRVRVAYVARANGTEGEGEAEAVFCPDSVRAWRSAGGERRGRRSPPSTVRLARSPPRYGQGLATGVEMGSSILVRIVVVHTTRPVATARMGRNGTSMNVSPGPTAFGVQLPWVIWNVPSRT